MVSTAKYFVPRVLGGFCAQYPDIDIRLEVLNRDGVVQRLREQRDDLAIMSMPPTDLALDDAVFLPNLLVLIAPGDHPLAQAPELVLDALAGERFILRVLRERGSGTRMAADAHFRAAGFRPQFRLKLCSNEAIKEAVAGGSVCRCCRRTRCTAGRANMGSRCCRSKVTDSRTMARGASPRSRA
ncbi:LysR substrate-binding domain-containing protein [uncultured Sphaerotilus sp.]|uniref:LysR substrate-binding domain-containing protein n=1 Tax=uncultured Sphaerotilus sp. TaxID=474984 RepID=UPI0030CA55BF